LEPIDDSLDQEDIDAARDVVRAYAEQLADEAHAHALLRSAQPSWRRARALARPHTHPLQQRPGES
jgi:hypothetical protein